MVAFPNNAAKDAWILRALAAGKIHVMPDGLIMRPGDLCMKEVTLSTHKKSGRVYFTLTFEGISKSVLANRVVGLALIPNPLNLPEVNHIDGVKAHNMRDNLEWSTKGDNEKHAHATGLKSSRGSANGNAKLTPADVQMIRQTPTASLSELAQRLSVSKKTVRDVRDRTSWDHI